MRTRLNMFMLGRNGVDFLNKHLFRIAAIIAGLNLLFLGRIGSVPFLIAGYAMLRRSPAIFPCGRRRTWSRARNTTARRKRFPVRCIARSRAAISGFSPVPAAAAICACRAARAAFRSPAPAAGTGSTGRAEKSAELHMEVHTMTMEEILTSGLAELGVPATAAQALRSSGPTKTPLDERSKVMNLTAIQGEEATARAALSRQRRAAPVCASLRQDRRGHRLRRGLSGTCRGDPRAGRGHHAHRQTPRSA